MKTLILLILFQITPPLYQFKTTSSFIQSPPDTTKVETNINYNSQSSGPRRVSGLDGWAFWLWWGFSNGVPSDASNSDMYDYYDYIQAGGNLSYLDWYNNKYNPTPLDNETILILFAILYSIIIKKSQINKKKGIKL